VAVFTLKEKALLECCKGAVVPGGVTRGQAGSGVCPRTDSRD
jgi:hypothetical protein